MTCTVPTKNKNEATLALWAVYSRCCGKPAITLSVSIRSSAWPSSYHRGGHLMLQPSRVSPCRTYQTLQRSNLAAYQALHHGLCLTLSTKTTSYFPARKSQTANTNHHWKCNGGLVPSTLTIQQCPRNVYTNSVRTVTKQNNN